MEDIYDNLDNYEDVNAVQELRSENQVLKEKVEEYTAAMGKLQKDYDNLALEFKNLETNFSSLLKTARAEIERKTQIITNLNIEKDMMVLKSLQNGNNLRRNFYRIKPNVNNISNASKKQDNDKKIDESNNTNAGSLIERKERNSLQSLEPVTVPSSENSNEISSKNESNTTKKCVTTTRNSDFKENDRHEQNPSSKVVASSIRNRRKSMPAVCVQDKLSSDESERQCPTKDIIKNDIPINSQPERKHLDRAPVDRTSSNKTSESSSIDDRNYNYQEQSREIQKFRNRSHRYCDDKYKDKYEISQRYRRHHSPDRGQRRLPREYHDDHHHKWEHGRYRVLVSPPPDPHHHNNHASNYHQRRNREHRPNYDRHTYEYDRHRNRYEEKQPYKHRLPEDHEEPASKRQRIDLFSHTGQSYSQKEERYTEMELIDKMPDAEYTLGIQDTSCQSPDYIHTEVMSAHLIKEIMNTSVIPLEDPRKCSNKYLLKTDTQGVTTISTVTGRNIDVVPIDKTAWNIERVDIPRALTNHPLQFDEELVHEIYMDIDNPVANMSMESGELYSENDSKNKETGYKQETSQLHKPMEEYSHSSEPIKINVKDIQTSSASKYRIPKIKHRTLEKTQNSAKLNLHKVTCESRVDDNKHEYNSGNSITNSVLDRRHDKMYSDKDTQDSEMLLEVKSQYQSQMNLSAKVNVEGDLELSDENSDVEINRLPDIKTTVFQATENRSTEVVVAPSNINDNESSKLPDNNNIKTCIPEIDCKKYKSKKKYDEVVETTSNVDEKNSQILPDNETEKCCPEIGCKKNKSKKNSAEINVSPRNINDNDSHKVPDINTKKILINDCKKNKSKNKDTEVVVASCNINENACRNLPNNDSDNLNLEIDESTEKTKESIGKKHKSKKKSKSKQSVDNVEMVQVPDKKTKLKKDKEKPKIIDNKFSDLFGDSGSLIMPEDLGLVSYVPCLEDTQDAVDLNINQITKQELYNVNQVNNSVVNIKNVNKGNPNPAAKCQEMEQTIESDVVENVDGGDNVIIDQKSMEINKEIKAPELTKNVYENLNPNIDVDNSGIVKTVVISMGVQPQFNIEGTVEQVLEQPVAIVESDPNVIPEANQSLAINEFKRRECMKALATSTPHKEFGILMETENRVIESGCCMVGSIDSITSAVDQSETNTLDSNVDVPDVRIFVKRRRKIIKKSSAS